MSSEQQMDLCAPFIVEDVRRAVFDIAETKAAGPDEYSSGFYKSA